MKFEPIANSLRPAAGVFLALAALAGPAFAASAPQDSGLDVFDRHRSVPVPAALIFGGAAVSAAAAAAAARKRKSRKDPSSGVE